MLKFYFLEKGLGIVPLPHFGYDFSRKMLLMLNTIIYILRDTKNYGANIHLHLHVSVVSMYFVTYVYTVSQKS